MQYPGYATLDGVFGEVQIGCDIAITPALTRQAINGVEDSKFLPKRTHVITSFTFNLATQNRKHFSGKQI